MAHPLSSVRHPAYYSPTWPDPPTDSKLTEGEPSKKKPRKRGEKSLYDEDGGEWRPHKPDRYHDEGHWNYKPVPTDDDTYPEWKNIRPDGTEIPK